MCYIYHVWSYKQTKSKQTHHSKLFDVKQIRNSLVYQLKYRFLCQQIDVGRSSNETINIFSRIYVKINVYSMYDLITQNILNHFFF